MAPRCTGLPRDYPATQASAVCVCIYVGGCTGSRCQTMLWGSSAQSLGWLWYQGEVQIKTNIHKCPFPWITLTYPSRQMCGGCVSLALF